MTIEEYTEINEDMLQVVSNLGLVVNYLDSLASAVESMAWGLREEGVPVQSVDCLEIVELAVREIRSIAENGLHESFDKVDCNVLIKKHRDSKGNEKNNEAE